MEGFNLAETLEPLKTGWLSVFGGVRGVPLQLFFSCPVGSTNWPKDLELVEAFPRKIRLAGRNWLVSQHPLKVSQQGDDDHLGYGFWGKSSARSIRLSIRSTHDVLLGKYGGINLKRVESTAWALKKKQQAMDIFSWTVGLSESSWCWLQTWEFPISECIVSMANLGYTAKKK